ncbi:MAG: hypothetical protein V4608_14170 [Bacteroidota bacterium]
MKKISVLLLLVIFLFNTVGYFIAFKAVQYQVKKEIKSEIKQGLQLSEFTVITIDKDQLKQIDWVENGKEMYYKGELYDIVKSSENITSITFHCINDKQEKKLFAHLDEHINNHIASNKPLKNGTSKKLTDHIIKLYFSCDPYLQLNQIASTLKHYSSINPIYLSPHVDSDFIPPELV